MAARGLWLWSGIAGIVAVIGYLLTIFLPVSESHVGNVVLLIVACAFPILGIAFSYGLFKFIEAERPSAVNVLGAIFSVTAFATFLAMTVVRLAVREGITEITRLLGAVEADAVRRGVRMVDLGLDVAWDILFASALVFVGMALRRRTGFGPLWGYVAVVLAVALAAVNIFTFPRPPADWGLFDFSPIAVAFILILAARLAQLGSRQAS